MKTDIAVVGAGGYAASELFRLLPYHPALGTLEAYARHPEETPHPTGVEVRPTERLGESRAGLVFLALPPDASRTLAPLLLEEGRRVVDLSGGHRLPDPLYRLTYGDDGTPTRPPGAYGLPEWFGDDVAKADLLANPGCYATALLLLLSPLLKSGVHVPFAVATGISGHSGAGRSRDAAHLLAEAMDDVRAYKVVQHVHVNEVEHVLQRRFGEAPELHFTPHLGPYARGILATVHVPLHVGEHELYTLMADAYATSPFVEVLPKGEQPRTRRVLGTNRAEIGLASDPRGWAVLTLALDNLGKGAAGQAIQNMNLMLGLPEELGLDHPPLVM